MLAVFIFFVSATQENTDSDKEQEQCPENFLTRFRLILC
jgi:hypothetical protein